MSKEKIRISVIDFIPEHGEHQIGHVDSNGDQLHIGDTVEYNSQNWIIVYRYRTYMLKQIGLMAMIGLTDWTKITKVNQLTAGPDWLIIGYEDDPLFENLSEFLESQDKE